MLDSILCEVNIFREMFLKRTCCKKENNMELNSFAATDMERLSWILLPAGIHLQKVTKDYFGNSGVHSVQQGFWHRYCFIYSYIFRPTYL